MMANRPFPCNEVTRARLAFISDALELPFRRQSQKYQDLQRGAMPRLLFEAN